MAAVSFAQGLGAHLESKKRTNFWERRLKKIVDAKPSKRRTAILERLEKEARVKLGVSAVAKIDWGNIDWKAVLSFIIKLLMLLAPLFLGVPDAVEEKPKRRRARGRIAGAAEQE